MILSLLGIMALIAISAVGSLAFRLRKEREIQALWRSLDQAGVQKGFDPSMVENLPGPARRYFLHAIEPGTPLAASARLAITGSIRLSRDREPVPMESEEILGPPRGYVWKARLRPSWTTIRGFDAYADGEAEMRWWLAGLVPVVHASGQELARSAAGRLIGEAIFVPSTLLPAQGARWEAVGDSTARVRMASGGEEVTATLDLEENGNLQRVCIHRWNNDPRNGPVGYLPFVVDGFADEATFDGYTIPTRFQAGWHSGEGEEAPFYYANVTEVEYR